MSVLTFIVNNIPQETVSRDAGKSSHVLSTLLSWRSPNDCGTNCAALTRHPTATLSLAAADALHKNRLVAGGTALSYQRLPLVLLH